MYALDGHEPHWFHADEDVYCICSFSPPCDGPELHDEDGVFPYIGDDGVPDYSFWSNKRKKGEKIMVELNDLDDKSKS